MNAPQNLIAQILTWLPRTLGPVRHWIKNCWQCSVQENGADQPLLKIAGSLSGEPMSVEQIETELYN